VLEVGLVTHCHEMDFVELDDRHDCCADENVLEMDLSVKKNPKIIALNDAVLRKKSWRCRG
jgi:hypothetical protein